MKYFSIKTNDQKSIIALLHNEQFLRVNGLTWYKDEVEVNDIIYYIISGDSSKKEIEYENGLRAIAKVINAPFDIEGKSYSIDVEILTLFDKSITKDDFYPYPQLKNVGSIGPETKQAPNQAIRLLNFNDAYYTFAALNDMGFAQNLNNLFINDSKLDLIKLKSSNNKHTKPLINEFVKWFFLPENFLKSYEGLVNYQYLNFIDETFFNGLMFKIDEKDVKSQIENKLSNIRNKSNKLWSDFNFSTSKGAPSAVLGSKNYIRFLQEKYGILDVKLQKIDFENILFNIHTFSDSLSKANLQFNDKLVKRFVTSLITKPFVILTGLSGSGKTKLAQSFIQWICESEEQYKIVPVGADWINREPLLGYPNGLDKLEYVTPDNGVLELMIKSSKPENQDKPYFLVLDEMNLSHVERYFADFLSIMESEDSIKLYTGSNRESTKAEDIPQTISWPKNLFIIGTVNIDETTYMFSPKVLDRANVIEFRLDEEDLNHFLSNPLEVDLTQLISQGSSMASSFLALMQEKETAPNAELNTTLIRFFKELKTIGAEFGYRSALEMHLLFAQFAKIDATLSTNNKVDFAVMQKLLPKLHGSRSKIVKSLEALMILCLEDANNFNIAKLEEIAESNIKYKVSFNKLKRMYYNALTNGFTSYAEA
ncbi:hypothetical protein H1R17_10895 [Flavobacterium sp. xlx-214]|uniref:McrB family protein n=1 Tax=unclassified Flavobacterium TaxID=196869 RepID=UPI0013D79419|nr:MULTISPECIES: hypothetical protein [unclassified Flavobacterium]MBA5791720.1 hypothetical protein [Flavobacterium sp. xlx-221]QMI82959.1 hypothetical protein H1R17_10895 [Flavobacterium sp. xlx-214]